MSASFEHERENVSVLYMCADTLSLLSVFMFSCPHTKGRLPEGERRPISCYVAQKDAELFSETQMRKIIRIVLIRQRRTLSVTNVPSQRLSPD